MARPDFDFRPNPARSIRVFSELTEQIVSNVVAQIIELRRSSTEPITVFINSPGGIVRGLEIIHGCLKSADADNRVCRIITVAIGDAASAAANLLGLGDYALAYPYSIVHFHGIRRTEVEVTKEDAQWLADYLASRNRQTALLLAEMMLPRMVHRYSRVKDGFEAIRTDNPGRGNEEKTDIECFLLALHGKVSTMAARVLNQSYSRLKSALKLSDDTVSHIEWDGKTPVQQDVAVFKAVFDHDVAENEADGSWRLTEAELQGIIADYLLLRDFHIGEHLRLLEPIIDVFGADFLTTAEFETFKATSLESEEAGENYLHETARPRLLQFWNFAVLLCRRLQEGENRLTATDAYWLGVVDEVIGTDLHGDRAIAEAELSNEENPPLAASQEPEG